MPTPAQAEAYSRNQARVVVLAHRELAAFWATLDKSNPVAAKEAIADFMVTLVDGYGPLSATIAADHYDELRLAAAVRGTFAAMPSGSSPIDQIRSAAMWAAQPLFPSRQPVAENLTEDVLDQAPPEIPSDEDAALQRLLGASQRLVQDAGRATLTNNAERDPVKPKFARCPHGETCTWCIMLASRGAVYGTAETAGGMTDWHDWCDCQIVPIFKGQDLPYDRDAALEQYKANQTKGGKKKAPESSSEVNVYANTSTEKLRDLLAKLEANEANVSTPYTRDVLERIRREIASRSL